MKRSIRPHRHWIRRAWLSILVITLSGALVAGCEAPELPFDLPWQDEEEEVVPVVVERATPVSGAAPIVALPGEEEAEEVGGLTALYRAAVPSIVNIEIEGSPQAVGARVPGAPSNAQGRVLLGEGSGWIYDESGYIVTNNHVVENAEVIRVSFHDGTWAIAELVARDPQSDLAVLKVDPPDSVDLDPLPVAPPGSLQVGEYVVALGSPFSLDETMTLGIVSALGRTFPVGSTRGAYYSLPEIIQTDAAINPGNSGGPLLNMRGEVVGVNFAIYSPAGASAGVGFAIPVSIFGKIVPALIEEGAYAYSYLGISGNEVSAQLTADRGMAANRFGVQVAATPARGPAEEAGVRVGDIITAIDDQPIRHFEDITGYLLTETEPGDTVVLELLRDGRVLTVDVELAARPTPELAEERSASDRLSIDEAIAIAQAAVMEAGVMREVEAAEATPYTLRDVPVWLVVLTGSRGERATVAIHAQTGEILDITAQ